LDVGVLLVDEVEDGKEEDSGEEPHLRTC
jgi:hypothetical protein